MPLRNLSILLLTALICIVCRVEAGRSRYSAAISDAISTITRDYVEEVKPRKLFEDSIHGMLDGLDPYSSFMPPAENEQFTSEIEQKFGGIGVEIGIQDDQLTVLSPLPGTPAFRAGLLAGDTILEISGQDTTGFDMEDCVGLIKGDPGTSIDLLIRHKGDTEPVAVSVERAIIQIESVRGERRKPNGEWLFTLSEHPEIAYFRLSTFAKNSADEIEAIVRSFDESITGLIIDLRQNPGGLLDVGIQTCDLFLDAGETVVTIRGRGGYLQHKYDSISDPVCDPNLPIVVLVDKFSASASEIFAACMQDHGRARIVGQRTYGKGTVQNVIEMSGGGAMRLTTATYWRPSEKNIHRRKDATEDEEWGVQPKPADMIEITDEEYVKLLRQRLQQEVGSSVEADAGESETTTDATDDVETRTDPFMDRAIDIILGRDKDLPGQQDTENERVAA